MAAASIALAMLSGTTKIHAQDVSAAIPAPDVLTLTALVGAIDRTDGTVSLLAPGGVLVVAVRDRERLEGVQVGDPVVARYYEAVILSVVPASSASSDVSATESLVGSRPGMLPAGVLERQVTLTTTVVSVDQASRTVTIRGPRGRSETLRTQGAAGLDKLTGGDLVSITYTRALAIGLDKRGSKPREDPS
jgi:hypothetical protein